VLVAPFSKISRISSNAAIALALPISDIPEISSISVLGI
jgi:hypothetical protein